MATKRKGLGRGLDALLANSSSSSSLGIKPSSDEEGEAQVESSREELKHVAVEFIQRGKY